MYSNATQAGVSGPKNNIVVLNAAGLRFGSQGRMAPRVHSVRWFGDHIGLSITLICFI